MSNVAAQHDPMNVNTALEAIKKICEETNKNILRKKNKRKKLFKFRPTFFCLLELFKNIPISEK
jgi:predicted nucleic acid-binding Zn ribbon protein